MLEAPRPPAANSSIPHGIGLALDSAFIRAGCRMILSMILYAYLVENIWCPVVDRWGSGEGKKDASFFPFPASSTSATSIVDSGHF